MMLIFKVREFILNDKFINLLYRLFILFMLSSECFILGVY